MAKKNSEVTNKAKEIFTKIKNIKHIEIIIAILAIAIMLLIFSSGNNSIFNTSKLSSTSTSEETTNEITTTTTTGSYLDTENELSKVLSKIEGVGEVDVMINYESTSEKITAKTISNNTTNTVSGTNSSTTTNTTESPVILTNNGNSQPYILKEVTPEIVGVIVVAEGADNAVVKLAIMRACQTILQVNANNIEIFTMK